VSSGDEEGEDDTEKGGRKGRRRRARAEKQPKVSDKPPKRKKSTQPEEKSRVREADVGALESHLGEGRKLSMHSQYQLVMSRREARASLIYRAFFFMFCYPMSHTTICLFLGLLFTLLT
jgi:hypothetical protein